MWSYLGGTAVGEQFGAFLLEYLDDSWAAVIARVGEDDEVVASDMAGEVLRLVVLLEDLEDDRGERFDDVVATQETSNVVAEAAVPFLPCVADEAAHLIEAGGIPRFGNELCSSEHWIRFDIPQNRRVGQWISVQVARQD